MRCVRPDGHRAIGTVANTPGGVRGRLSDAFVAESAGFHLFERSESLDVETRAHADQMNQNHVSLDGFFAGPNGEIDWFPSL